MCGIAGFFVRDGQGGSDALLRSMTGILAHRGPDGDGFFREAGVGLGHRRLAIIDLVTGDQPMSNDDGTVTLVFNGEIYNFRELRAELERRGHRFRTASDTEAILRAYETWELGCVERLRGMFAFALWDRRRRRLLLARDRVGIKPLVYAWDGHRLLFASELKAILQDSSVPRELDWEALHDFLTFHYVPSPRTIFRGVRKLPPASYLVIDQARGQPEVRRYWDLRFAPDESRRDDDWLAGLRARLEDAVRSHLVADVPLGAFLSGGMDSSTVVALMAAVSRQPVRTFSIGFDDTDFDELGYARQVARRFGTDHYEFVVKPDALEALPRLGWQLDEPFADSSALPTYYVAKITREHVTVALSGDGGDENFAGYRRYATALGLHQRYDRLPGRLIRSLLRQAARLLPAGARGQGYLELLGADPVDRYAHMVTFQRQRSLGRLLTRDARAAIDAESAGAAFRRLAAEGNAPDYLSTLQYIDVRQYLPDDILAKVDFTSMLVSLEARVPLLDHVLMEYVATMPSRLKFRNGSGKAILKRVMAADLPAEILDRRKMGFGVPLAAWFRDGLGQYARELLLDRRARQRGVVSSPVVERLLAEHRRGHRDRSSQLWALLCLEEWARRWWDR
jgi:asparagine synthase (glutamine-hydrolysing)